MKQKKKTFRRKRKNNKKNKSKKEVNVFMVHRSDHEGFTHRAYKSPV